MNVGVVHTPSASQSNSHYCTNRPPLSSSFLAKLPLGSVRPKGWLKHQLDLMARGMTGRLMELSPSLKNDNGCFGTENPGWGKSSPTGCADSIPWRFSREMNAASGKQSAGSKRSSSTRNEDGYFGPPDCRAVPVRLGPAQYDLWPHMLIFDALEAYYEQTGDRRVIDLMSGFFRFCRAIPDDRFLPFTFKTFEERNWLIKYLLKGNFHAHIQNRRCGEMIPHIHWLYNHTGERELLALATRFFRKVLPPMSEWLEIHVINFIHRQSFPAYYYPQSADRYEDLISMLPAQRRYRMAMVRLRISGRPPLTTGWPPGSLRHRR